MNKIYFKSLAVALLLSVSFTSYSQIISTIAGDSAQGFSGDGGQATAAELNYPYGVAVDASGNVYITDGSNERIRVVNTSGIISTFAGIGGGGGFYGDGGPATAAELYLPECITLDALGNVYFADQTNQRIRTVNTAGIINTIAGNGITSYSGDGGPATAAELHAPAGVALDASGNIYIADLGNQRIRIVNTSGIISTFAGNGAQGFYGDGGQATAAELNRPSAVALDASGNLYIAEAGNNRIRKVNTSGIISTIAGNGTGNFSGDGGPATDAEINNPFDVTIDTSGNIYIADHGNNRIRMVNTTGIINTIAGNGTANYSGDGGPATAAELKSPYGVAVDASNNIYIGDSFNQRIRKLSAIPTGANKISFIYTEVTIFPIPNTGQFTIKGLSQEQVIEIYNYTGQKILSAISHGSSANFDISNYPNGIYLIRVLNKDGSVVATKKIVKTE